MHMHSICASTYMGFNVCLLYTHSSWIRWALEDFPYFYCRCARLLLSLITQFSTRHNRFSYTWLVLDWIYACLSPPSSQFSIRRKLETHIEELDDAYRLFNNINDSDWYIGELVKKDLHTLEKLNLITVSCIEMRWPQYVWEDHQFL